VDEFHEFITASGRDMQGCDTYDGEWKHRPKNNWKNPGFTQAGTHPVTCASWNDAEAYARWLSTETKHRYRLPSASEWEYAARAGGEAVQPWSADGSSACANANLADESAAHRYPGWTVFGCDDGYVYTAPVGSLKANSFGLNDMLGNVLQWTEDCWRPDYSGAPIDGSARTDGNCSERELRGSSWFTTPAYVRADYRNHFAIDHRTSSVGNSTDQRYRAVTLRILIKDDGFSKAAATCLALAFPAPVHGGVAAGGGIAIDRQGRRSEARARLRALPQAGESGRMLRCHSLETG